MSSYSSKPLPPLDEFATMLETLFAGTPETPLQPNHLTQEPWAWTLQELMGAVEKCKLNKSADESRLVGAVFFFFFPLLFLAEGLSWMTVLLGSLQATPFLYRRLRMCMKGWAKSKPQLLRGGLGDGW